MAEPAVQSIEAFIARWQGSGAAERANYQLFLSELCDVLGVARPEPKTPYEDQNAYVFEKSVPLPHDSMGSIDLYKRGCFVLEAKQGSDPLEDGQIFSETALRRQQSRRRGTAVRVTASWHTAMEKARQQLPPTFPSLATMAIQFR